jgi:hypothetical protein
VPITKKNAISNTGGQSATVEKVKSTREIGVMEQEKKNMIPQAGSAPIYVTEVMDGLCCAP